MAVDLSFVLDDRPGELARIGEALGNAGVNIEGVCGVVHDGRGIVHVLVEDGDAAREALSGAGIQIAAEAEPIVADMSGQADEPGSLGMAARAIADAGVNIVALYLGTNNRGVMVTSDNAKALEAAPM